MARGLLSRLAERESGTPTASLEQAILDHLHALLNTRQGGSALDLSYGLPDLTDALHDFPRGIAALQREIELAISRGEPRLERVSARALAIEPHSLVLRFEVVAQIRSGATLRFQTEVSRGGRIHVS